MRFKSPLGATGKTNSAAANRTISRKHSFHTFLSIWMLVDLMTKECQKVKHQLEARLLKALTSNIRAIQDVHLARCEHFKLTWNLKIETWKINILPKG